MSGGPSGRQDRGDAPASSNQQSADLTASALHHPGGRIVVVVAGIGLLAGGAYIAYEAWRKRFLRQLTLAGAGAAARRVVTWLGRPAGSPGAPCSPPPGCS